MCSAETGLSFEGQSKLRTAASVDDGSISSFDWQLARSRLLAVLFQKFLDFQRGHATGAGRSDGLTLAAVLHVAASVDALHAGEDVVVSFEIAVRVGVELAGKHLCVGLVADSEE